MSVLNREEFMSRLKERIGEDTSDDAMTFIEDFTDTYNDMESKVTKDNSELEEKYNALVKEKDELDKSWREKYKARFFEGGETTPDEVKDEQTEDVKEDGEEVTFEDLFEEREG